MNEEQEAYLWSGAVRYYIQRNSRPTVDFCFTLIQEWSKLNDKTRSWIRSDVEHAIAQSSDDPLGQLYEETWNNVRALWKK